MSLFGGTSNTQAAAGGGGGLFGSNAPQTNNAGGLFGSSTNQTSTTGGGGLFGSTANNAPRPAGTNMFAPSATQASTATGGGLFGNSNTSAVGGGLFGGNIAQTNSSTAGGLFGGNTAQTNSGTAGGLFGGTLPTIPQQSQPGTNNPRSLFSGGLWNSQPQPPVVPGQGTGSTQQQQDPQLSTSIFNPQTVKIGNHTLANSQLQRLQLSGYSAVPNEKRLAEQLGIVALKWNPQNPPNAPTDTTLKTYLYNAVPKEYAPFFYPNVADGEDEKSWEEALSQKPEPPLAEGQTVSSQAYVPIICKGFKALGQRAEVQAKIIIEMRGRIHEMNHSLSAVMDAHQQRITVKVAAAKRQHQVLSQRCLRLAVKVQVLRNRGYAMDAAEENLRRTLMSLEKQVMDPGFVGREDEIWARMVSLRERARWLEEEGKRVSAQMSEQNRQGGDRASAAGVPEAVLAKTRKILKDYDGQLQHLSKELEEVKNEYAEWEKSQERRR